MHKEPQIPLSRAHLEKGSIGVSLIRTHTKESLSRVKPGNTPSFFPTAGAIQERLAASISPGGKKTPQIHTHANLYFCGRAKKPGSHGRKSTPKRPRLCTRRATLPAGAAGNPHPPTRAHPPARSTPAPGLQTESFFAKPREETHL